MSYSREEFEKILGNYHSVDTTITEKQSSVNFIESVIRFYKKTGYLTDRQTTTMLFAMEEVLENIKEMEEE